MKFNQTFQFALICLISCTVFLNTGCKKDPCKDVVCQNGGTCNEGDCDCTSGYEGAKCETEVRAKFLGSYNVNENCNSGNYTYSSSITPSANSVDAIVIGNLGNFNPQLNVRATVSGNNLNINDTQGGVSFSGSGNISGNTLTIIYTISQAGSTDNCTANCIRQ